MNIRIICIGDELLSGDTLNTNLLYIGGRLAQKGLRLCGEMLVPDQHDSIMAALEASHNSDVVLMVGGLGPTRDDMTRPTAAEFLHRRLVFHPELQERIAAYLGERAKSMPQESLIVQSEVPEGGEALENRNGTAPGLLMEQAGTMYFLMPGPPREMKPMFDNEILPRILAKFQPEWDEYAMRIVGLGESIVENTVRSTLGNLADAFHLAFCIKNDNVMVRIAKRHDDSSLDLDKAFASLRQAFGNNMIPENCGSAVEYLGQILRSRKLLLSTAESCTGGGIAAAITDVPGSSEWFAGGFVTYCNEWKMRHLGVSDETLEKYGAVSAQTVSQMLTGLLANGKADLGIAVSGIAGPGGGTPEKPVGTVFIGIAGPGWQIIRHAHFNGLRDTVRQRTANTAVSMLISQLLA